MQTKMRWYVFSIDTLSLSSVLLAYNYQMESDHREPMLYCYVFFNVLVSIGLDKL